MMQNNGSKEGWAKALEGRLRIALPDRTVAVVLNLRQSSLQDIRPFLASINTDRLLDAIRDLVVKDELVAGLQGKELRPYNLPGISQLIVTQHTCTCVAFAHGGTFAHFNPEAIRKGYRDKYERYSASTDLCTFPVPPERIDLLMFAEIHDGWSFVHEPEPEHFTALEAEPRTVFDRIYYTEGSGDYHEFRLSPL
jgi:hypothetical protein